MDREQTLTALRERILAFATSWVSRDRAEDLTQEVLTVLHEKYPAVVEPAELVPLAFQVLRYKMLDLHRKSLRRGEYNQAAIDDLLLAEERLSLRRVTDRDRKVLDGRPDAAPESNGICGSAR
ncbi:MAG: hypothetical protein NTNFB02_25850 [Nitrospira sp.]